MKKVLFTATVASMLGQFNMDNMKILQGLGAEVSVACDFKDTSVWSKERITKFRQELEDNKIKYHQIDFPRNPLNIIKMFKSYLELKSLIKNSGFDLIHCHTPVASVISRIIAHFNRVKVIYTAHGFHFYTGAPIKNWIIFYPIEWLLSMWTDTLITINKEDYTRAQKHFKADNIIYVPGVGINLEKFSFEAVNSEDKRKQLGITEKDIVFLSVGELSNRKNHEIVIKAIQQISNIRIKYFIVGKGSLEGKLSNYIHEAGLEDNVKLLGFRSDIAELCQLADLFIFPSLQEGLPVALMEAISCKCPVICSRIRGNVDLVEEDSYLFNPNDAESVKDCIERLLNNESDEKIRTLTKDVTETNYRHLRDFTREKVMENMKSVYRKHL